MAEKRTRKVNFTKNNKPFLSRDNTLTLFYADIRRYKPLGREETNQLFHLYRNGSKEESKKAFETLFKHNIRLVITFTRSYCGTNDPMNDLIQEGCIGLIKAIEMFDVNNGTPFSIYALYWIRRYVNLFMVDMTTVVRQTNNLKSSTVISRITDELFQKYERVPTSDEILELYNQRFPNKQVSNTNDVVNVAYIYIDEFNTADKETTYHRSESEYNSASSSRNACNETFERSDNRYIIDKLLECLTEKEATAIKLLYGIDGTEMTLEMISNEMHITPQRASQLCSSAINKMKANTKMLAYVQSN